MALDTDEALNQIRRPRLTKEREMKWWFWWFSWGGGGEFKPFSKWLVLVDENNVKSSCLKKLERNSHLCSIPQRRKREQKERGEEKRLPEARSKFLIRNSEERSRVLREKTPALVGTAVWSKRLTRIRKRTKARKNESKTGRRRTIKNETRLRV